MCKACEFIANYENLLPEELTIMEIAELLVKIARGYCYGLSWEERLKLGRVVLAEILTTAPQKETLN